MYLIIGGSGFLGRYCVRNILEQVEEDIIATYCGTTSPPLSHPSLKWVRLDIRDRKGLDCLNERLKSGAKCLFLAAYHHPDLVEENPVLAWDINIVALADALNRLDRVSCLYYASTDGVYGDGDRAHKFVEDDTCRPVNLYGRHKALAERIVLAKDYNVLRLPFIFGPSLIEGRQHFYDGVTASMATGKPVKMLVDSWRSPLSFDQCARYMVSLAKRYAGRHEKVVNVASDKAMSKYDLAVAMANRLGYDKALVEPIHLSESNGFFKVKRASTCLMDNSKLKGLLGLGKIKMEI